MADSYYHWQARGEKPEAERQFTPAERRANWWYYHKWHVILGALLLLVLLDVGKSALHIGEVLPDYEIAYVGAAPLPEDTARAVEAAFAALGRDANGDGQVAVRLNQYPLVDTAERDAALYKEASRVRLMADMESCTSFFFLLSEPETFHAEYALLARRDGSAPGEREDIVETCCLRWEESPALKEAELGRYTETVAGQEQSGENRDLLEGLYLARRVFPGKKAAANPAACEELWNTLQGGAA